MTKSFTIPAFYLLFIKKYIELNLYKSENDFLLKALKVLIQREEERLKDMGISRLMTEIDLLRDKCSLCTLPRNESNCNSCIRQINAIVSIKKEIIANLLDF